jgi:hypothetical protein
VSYLDSNEFAVFLDILTEVLLYFGTGVDGYLSILGNRSCGLCLAEAGTSTLDNRDQC